MNLKKKVKRLEDALKAIRDFKTPEDLSKYADWAAYCNTQRQVLASNALKRELEMERLQSLF